MKVSEAGEFGLIELLCRELGVPYPPSPESVPRPGFIVDLGDDAAVMEPSADATVWTTDTLVEGVHFLPSRTSWRNTGWKAIAVNVSDVAAMGGTPGTALVTLCLPPEFCLEHAVELYRGMRECCEAYGVTVSGGDIVRSPVFTVTVAVSGVVRRGPDGGFAVLRRNACRPGDAVAVSGTLGDAAAGVLLLGAGGAAAAAAASLIEAQERPRPRLDVSARAVAAGLRCGMDVSDGLLQDAGHIARASGVRIRLEAGAVPLSPTLLSAFPERALELALTGGEDYQLLLCGARGVIEGLIVEGADLTIIGDALEGEPGVTVIGEDGLERHYPATGWDHFRSGPRA
ncbi:MAG TPA: thiamine-phosphate kinase [Dehalococcoidia bacterium]|nr:thiamine-phosphate kinase [Dehalococcoidia bacterium]